MMLLEKKDTALYYISFEDEVLSVHENQVEYGISALQSYRKKVNHYLQNHQDDISVYKLRNNKTLTDPDYKHIEHLLWHELGTENEYHKTFGDKPLMQLVAGLVGLERSAANLLFSEFISDQTLNLNQIEFVQMIVEHIVENGALDKNLLNDHPFNKHGSITQLFNNRVETVRAIVKRIDALNERIAV